MDLRFKHFGTFVVIMGMLGAVVVKVEQFGPLRPRIIFLALLLTVLFWLIDYRTSQYLADEIHRVRAFEKQLFVPNTGCPNRTVIVRASHATNVIFIVVLIALVSLLVAPR